MSRWTPPMPQRREARVVSELLYPRSSGRAALQRRGNAFFLCEAFSPLHCSGLKAGLWTRSLDAGLKARATRIDEH